MITVFTRKDCAYCPMVKKWLTYKNIDYQEKQAEGAEYQLLAERFGSTVPLILNGSNGMVGYNIRQLQELVNA